MAAWLPIPPNDGSHTLPVPPPEDSIWDENNLLIEPTLVEFYEDRAQMVMLGTHPDSDYEGYEGFTLIVGSKVVGQDQTYAEL